MPLAIAALVILFSLIAAAFFAAAETSLTAASRARLQAMESGGDNRAALSQPVMCAPVSTIASSPAVLGVGLPYCAINAM